jgi:hypothetical protein
MSDETTPMDSEQLTQAVICLMEKDEARANNERRKQRRRAQLRRKQREASIQQLAKSVEIMKWCLVGITSVMVLALLVLVLVVVEVEREAEKISAEVQRIQHEATLIRDKIRHPIQTLGATLGRRVENRIGEGLLDATGSEE